MIGTCGSALPDELVRSLLAVSECQANLLGTSGWSAMAGSGLFSAVLAAVLTLVVARLGYRLMAGVATAVEIAKLLIQIGFVLALTSNWQAYDRLVYRVAVEGPSEIAATIFPAAAIAPSDISSRLQNAYDAIRTPPRNEVAAQSGGRGDVAEFLSGAGTTERQASPARRAAADLMVVVGAGSWIAARLVLALMLAVGPLALLACFFTSTAGLFTGWVRILAGAALAAVVIPLAISLELQLLEFPVREALQEDTAEIAGLNVIVWSFALVTGALILAAQRLSGALVTATRVSLIAAGRRVYSDTVTATGGKVADPGKPVSGSYSPQAISSLSASHLRVAGVVHALEARTQGIAAAHHGRAAQVSSHLAERISGQSGARPGSPPPDRPRRTELGRDRGVPPPPEKLI